MQLDELRHNAGLMNAIDWDMTPEEAVTLYLEWGNNWTHGKYVIRSKNDVSHYFIVSTWETGPVIYLIRRNSEEAVELAAITMPEDIGDRFLKKVGFNKGVYAVDGEVRTWLEKELLKTEPACA